MHAPPMADSIARRWTSGIVLRDSSRRARSAQPIRRESRRARGEAREQRREAMSFALAADEYKKSSPPSLAGSTSFLLAMYSCASYPFTTYPSFFKSSADILITSMCRVIGVYGLLVESLGTDTIFSTMSIPLKTCP